ncbi:MAG: hypothetical protein NT031_03775 [Planctomycetota bacterium]|nr:hypothetical protein [Planctomycetota bacterium]
MRTRGEDILKHCRELDRCNQRGGRMLSVVDLLQAGTISEDLAAYSLAAIGDGASFMLGALPGGAGKTTVMGALLNFGPAEGALAVADGLEAIRAAAPASGKRTGRCYICHEISPGPYYAYLWGEAIRAFFDLPAAGHMLATNLHADTFDQAAEQLLKDNALSEEAFRRMNLIYFLSVTGRGRVKRQIAEVWETDGQGPHRRVFSQGVLGKSALGSPAQLTRAMKGIAAIKACGSNEISAVRSVVLEHLAGH